MPKTQTTIRLEESDYREAKIPNEETLKAMKEAMEGVNLEEITLEDLKAERNAS